MAHCPGVGWGDLKPCDWRIVRIGHDGAYHDADADAATHILICDPDDGIGVLRIEGRAIDDPAPAWEWNGSMDKPTLRPSIQQTHPLGWHGWLTDGVWASA